MTLQEAIDEVKEQGTGAVVTFKPSDLHDAGSKIEAMVFMGGDRITIDPVRIAHMLMWAAAELAATGVTNETAVIQHARWKAGAVGARLNRDAILAAAEKEAGK